jgi:hypothetical protein
MNRTAAQYATASPVIKDKSADGLRAPPLITPADTNGPRSA